MGGKRQFSLGYLLLEIAVFATALGLTRACFARYYEGPYLTFVGLAVATGAVLCWGATVGGLFGKIVLCHCAQLIAATTTVSHSTSRIVKRNMGHVSDEITASGSISV